MYPLLPYNAPTPNPYLMARYVCSSEPMSSRAPLGSCDTGRSRRAGAVDRNTARVGAAALVRDVSHLQVRRHQRLRTLHVVALPDQGFRLLGFYGKQWAIAPSTRCWPHALGNGHQIIISTA